MEIVGAITTLLGGVNWHDALALGGFSVFVIGMAWNDGIDRATNYIVTATNWNDLIGASGSLMQLKSHAHGGTTGEGSQAIGPLITEDFTDAAAPAAPSAGRTRLYTVSGKPRYRANGGADRAIVTDETAGAGDLAGTYPAPTVAKITLGSDADGDIYYRAAGVLARLAKGTALQLLRMNAGATAPEWSVPSGITLVTEQATTAGTSIDFTGLPSGVKRITVMLKDVSVSGTSEIMLQLGDSGGVEITGYNGARQGNTAGAAFTDGFRTGFTAAARILSGTLVLTLENASTNMWVCAGVISDYTGVTGTNTVAGYKSVSPGPLDRVRLTTVNGTDTFDLGVMSISYE